MNISPDRISQIIDLAIENYEGDSHVLATAIGVLVVGMNLGWKPTFLLHSTKSIKQYEGILNIKFRDVMPDVGRDSSRLTAWQIGQEITNYWKLVKCETPGARTPDWAHFKSN